MRDEFRSLSDRLKREALVRQQIDDERRRRVALRPDRTTWMIIAAGLVGVALLVTFLPAALS